MAYAPEGRTLAETAYIKQGECHRKARLAGRAFVDWLIALARLADPADPLDWLANNVVLNEDCWFESFSDGMTPAECWAEECSYD